MAPNSTRSAVRTRAGIADVATLAGVAQGTVSNVLNHPDRVTPTTIERVNRAIEILNYVPHEAARSLAAGRSRSIGLVLSDLGNSLFVEMARGAERAAAEADLRLLIANSNTQLEREVDYVRAFTQARTLGTLLTLNDETHFRALSGRAAHDHPMVLLNFHADDAQYCSAYVDNVHGGTLATEHLLERGRRRLVFVGGPESLQPVVERRQGFREAMARADITPVAEVMPSGVNRADGWQIGTRLHDQVAAGEIDGIIAASDLLAAGIVQALAGGANIRVPDDVSIVGYDNNQAAWDSPIPISTIAQPTEQLGYEGVRLLLDTVRNPEHSHEAVRLEPTLVQRSSS